MGRMTFIDAAREVLKEHPRGLEMREIFRRAVAAGYIDSNAKTPLNTMRANIYDHVKRKGPDAEFTSVGDGRWALARRKK